VPGSSCGTRDTRGCPGLELCQMNMMKGQTTSALGSCQGHYQSGAQGNLSEEQRDEKT